MVGLGVALIGMVIGVTLGLLAGFFGGWIDDVISRYVDLQWAFPELILAIALISVFGIGVEKVIIAIAFAYVDDFARLARAEALRLKEEEFVLAARVTGVSWRGIIGSEILPNAIGPIVVQATIAVGLGILAESTLTFLGLGVEPSTPTWGLVLEESRDFFQQAWWLSIFPGLAIVMTVLSLNLLGDSLRDAMDVRGLEAFEAVVALLEISDLHTHFDTPAGRVRAVNSVDLAIEEGEILGLVGESGSGKTVLAMSVLRLVPAPGRIVSGKVHFHGRNLLDVSEQEMREVRGGRIGVIFQDPMTSLNPVIRVGEQIAESIRLHQDVGESTTLWAEAARKFVPFVSGKGGAWTRAVEMLKLVGISDPERRARQYPHEFSGGMRQRVMIAVALSCKPDLLIADEPTTALDVTIQAEILKELRRLARQLHTAVLLITHDLGVVSRVCDRVAIMYAGKVFELASAKELIGNPQNPYTLALLRSIPELDTRREQLEPIEGTVPDLIDWEQGCLFSTRCPEVIEECKRTDPQLVRLPRGRTKLEHDHWCRCIRRESGST